MSLQQVKYYWQLCLDFTYQIWSRSWILGFQDITFLKYGAWNEQVFHGSLFFLQLYL